MDFLSQSQERQTTAQSNFLAKVYGWMAFALMLTAGTAFYVASSPSLIQAVYGNKILFWGLMIAELVLVFTVSGAINRISSSVATLLFFLYSLLNGVTMAFIFSVYTGESIAYTFMITAGTFGAMSLFGYVTKQDLTKFGSIALMALIGVIIASVVNIFLKSSTLYWIITIVGVLVFVGLVAYDTQKLKQLSRAGYDSETQRKLSIIGALTLYLDFINLFLFFLNIFGGRRD
ncbi:MAG: Bax inhibitor-1/YccA family protein [Tannerellaceae bacterium]